MSGRPVGIANVSGCLGDRYTAVDEVMAGDPVDVIMGDYLAEVTLAALAAGAARGRPGWVGYALDQPAVFRYCALRWVVFRPRMR